MLDIVSRDSDGDGIPDKDDDCPEMAGIPEFNGCPDSDGDGIEDRLDACPKIFGFGQLKGCPDSDGDGVPDPDDECPELMGIYSMRGCPDADGDNVPDQEDECPREAGPIENNGCPYEDNDNDGVIDGYDECPEVAGAIENNGCPIPEVNAETGRSSLQDAPMFPLPAPEPSDFEVLDKKFFENCEDLLDIYEKLNYALVESGYTKKSYFSVENGFAIATQLEQTNENGVPLAGTRRWNKDIIYPDLVDEFSLSAYISSLFKAQIGYYRLLIFVINSTPITFTGENISENIISQGATSLDEDLLDNKFTSRYNVNVLIYQFKKTEGIDDVELLNPSITPGDHITLIKRFLK